MQPQVTELVGACGGDLCPRPREPCPGPVGSMSLLCPFEVPSVTLVTADMDVSHGQTAVQLIWTVLLSFGRPSPIRPVFGGSGKIAPG